MHMWPINYSTFQQSKFSAKRFGSQIEKVKPFLACALAR